MSMEDKIAKLKKEVRMLRTASVELYVDLDNAKWKAEQCAKNVSPPTLSSTQLASTPLKTD